MIFVGRFQHILDHMTFLLWDKVWCDDTPFGLRCAQIFSFYRGELQVIIWNLVELRAMANVLNFTESISLKDRSSLWHRERCYNSPTVNRVEVIRTLKSARASFSHVLLLEHTRLVVIKSTLNTTGIQIALFLLFHTSLFK